MTSPNYKPDFAAEMERLNAGFFRDVEQHIKDREDAEVERLQAIEDALANSPYELAQCETCGELTIHFPQGLSPLCLKCAEADE